MCGGRCEWNDVTSRGVRGFLRVQMSICEEADGSGG